MMMVGGGGDNDATDDIITFKAFLNPLLENPNHGYGNHPSILASSRPDLSCYRPDISELPNHLFESRTSKPGSSLQHPFHDPEKFSSTSSPVAKAGWLLGLGGEKKKKSISMPDIVKAGDPVLHEPARDVEPGDIGSERIQKIIDDMVRVMRKAPGVGLAAPQIGIPLRCIECPLTPHHLASESVSVAIANLSAEPQITHFDKSSSTESTSLPPN
ncbi:hypothetical protein ACFX19_025658 [Malus domestica]